MTSLRFACIFVTLASVLVLAQSNSGLQFNQRSGVLPAHLQQLNAPNRTSPPSPRHDVQVPRARKSSGRTLPAQNGLSFAPAVGYDSGGYSAYAGTIADVNGDGKPDLLVTNTCASSDGNSCTSEDGSVGVLLGNGDGTFQTAIAYDSGARAPESIAVMSFFSNSPALSL